MEENRIAEALNEWLTKPGNTQVIAAQRIGIGEGTLRNRMSGYTPWKWSEAIKVARLTGKKVSDFE